MDMSDDRTDFEGEDGGVRGGDGKEKSTSAPREFALAFSSSISLDFEGTRWGEYGSGVSGEAEVK